MNPISFDKYIILLVPCYCHHANYNKLGASVNGPSDELFPLNSEY